MQRNAWLSHTTRKKPFPQSNWEWILRLCRCISFCWQNTDNKYRCNIRGHFFSALFGYRTSYYILGSSPHIPDEPFLFLLQFFIISTTNGMTKRKDCWKINCFVPFLQIIFLFYLNYDSNIVDFQGIITYCHYEMLLLYHKMSLK